MIYLCAFLLIAVTVSSANMPMLGAQKCTWGPSYWCDSVENAKECGQGSEDHCRAKVWVGNHPLAHLTDSISEQDTFDSPKVNCALCELIGKKIFEKLTNNATEEEVIGEMEQVCQILPKSYQDTCMGYVEEYGKMFYEAFVETADVHEICTMLGLCSEEFMAIVADAKLLTAVLERGLMGIPCDACQSLMALVQKEVLANEKDIEAMLDEVCEVLPVDQDECEATINQMFEAAITILESYKPLELCQLVGVCESNVADTLYGLGPVELGQEGQTGEASAANMVF